MKPEGRGPLDGVPVPGSGAARLAWLVGPSPVAAAPQPQPPWYERIDWRRLLLIVMIASAGWCLYHGITQPIIKLTQLYIFTDEHSLFSAVQALHIDQEYVLAGIVLVFSIAMPTLKLSYLSILALTPRRRLAALHRSLEWLEWLGKWSMHDVLILALTIVYLRASGLSEAVSMPGVRFFVIAVLLIMVSYRLLRSMARSAALELTGRTARTRVVAERGLSAWRRLLVGVLTLGAAGTLCLGVATPVIELTKFYWWTDRHSILSAVYALFLEQEYFLSGVIFVFSVLFPTLKLFYLLIVAVMGTQQPERQQRVLNRLELLGKWSMMDVLVLALTVFYVNASQFATAVALPGIYAFTASVLLTMVAYALVKAGLTRPVSRRYAVQPAPVRRGDDMPMLEAAS